MRIPHVVSALALLLGALPAQAQSSVWKVTSGTNTIYIGGTCHVLRPQDYPLPTEFDLAYAASSVLYFETDVGKLQDPAFQQVVMAQAMAPDGKTLDKILSPAALKALQGLAASNGIPIAALLPLRASIVATMIPAMELQKIGVTQDGVDVHFYNLAKAAGKKTEGFETVEQQLKMILNLGVGHESDMILEMVDEIVTLPKDLGELLDSWRSGNLAKIDEANSKDLRDKYPEIYAEILVSRNKAWLPAIDGLLKTAPVEFVLVGDAHLAGPDGLIAAFTKSGYKVEQVVAPKK